MRSSVTVETFAVGPLGCACTIVADGASGDAIVIDGGDDADEIVRRLDARGVRASRLLHTHAHVDHIGALGDLRARTGARGALHAADLPLYATVAAQARMLGTPAPTVVALDDALRDGDVLVVGDARVEVLHTPGHTPGSVCFALDALGATRILAGDTLFAGSVGRVDLGGTTLAELTASVREKLFAYANETPVVPGHGPSTTIGRERATNPYFTTAPRAH